MRDENIELLGGRAYSERKDFIARTVGEFQRVSDIEDVILQTNKTGSTVRLKDIATVSDAYAVQRVKTKLANTEGVKLSIFKQAGANTVEVSDRGQTRIKELQHVLPPDVRMEVIYDQAEYIRASVSGVRDAALIAAVLVVFATAFFLTGWRRVVIIALALPVTLLGTFFLMRVLGYSINILSLGGLVVAITVLLDNAVVVLENITRLQTEEPEERTPVQTGATQVSGAVLTATLTFSGGSPPVPAYLGTRLSPLPGADHHCCHNDHSFVGGGTHSNAFPDRTVVPGRDPCPDKARIGRSNG